VISGQKRLELLRKLVPAWQAAGSAMFDWLAGRPEIDAQKIGIIGSSFGSLFSTIAASSEPRYAAIAVAATCLEPGCHTIFEEASPTFKKRFMYMSGIPNEDEFDKFRKTLTWEGHVDKINAPYLCLAGEFELCPLEHTERMFRAMKGPRQLVVYADSRHSVNHDKAQRDSLKMASPKSIRRIFRLRCGSPTRG
jgi:dienelactone hydrolase